MTNHIHTTFENFPLNNFKFLTQKKTETLHKAIVSVFNFKCEFCLKTQNHFY